MSEIFHKSCYTSRSSGYKYRTFSTNTGERKRRDKHEDTTFDRMFNELERAITSRVDNQVYLTQKARDCIEDKFNKINEKIDSMLKHQDTINSLRKTLQNVECSMADMLKKIDNMEAVVAGSEDSAHSKKSSFRVTE